MPSPPHSSSRWVALQILVLALVVAWPAALTERLVPTVARAVTPGANGRILFVSSPVTPEHPDGETNMFSMSADGSDVRQIRSDGVTFEHASIGLALSPDGRQIAFSDDTQDIHLMNVDGSNLRRITTGLFSFGPLAWSPDGSKIAYIQVGARHDIWVMNTDGSNRTLLTNNASSINTRPDWSPDGSQIVYEANPPGGGGMGIWVMDANGANGARIAAEGNDPSWSPDGERIAFTRGGDLYTMQPSGADVQQVTNTPEFDANVYWAPAGNRLLFTTDSAQGGTDIFTIKPDGTGRQQLSHDGVSRLPVWQTSQLPPIKNPPKVVQSEAIVFSSNRITAENPEGDFEIFLMEMDPLAGDVTTQLTLNTSHDREPQWSPDGLQIAFTCDTTICTVGADGSNLVRLTFPPQSASDRSPIWAPDGSRIAFVRDLNAILGCPCDLFTIRPDGSDLVQVAQKIRGHKYFDSAVTWAPDSNRLTFALALEFGSDIFVDSSRGGSLVNLTNTPFVTEDSPAWSPNGNYIAFFSESGGALMRMNADGGQPVRLSNGIEHGSLAWSPDSSRLAFWRYGLPSEYEIYTVNADGSSLVNRTHSPDRQESHVAWSPDGKWIALSNNAASDVGDVFTMRANGANLTNRTSTPISVDYDPDWRPALQSNALAGRAEGQASDNSRRPDNAAGRSGDPDKSRDKGKAEKQRDKRQQERKRDQKRNKHQRKHTQRAKQKQRQRAGEERDAPRRAKTRTRRRIMIATPE